MDSRCLKLMRAWAMLAQKEPNADREGLAAAVYFGVMDRTPPEALLSITNAMDLCDFFQREMRGRGLTDDEKLMLIAVAQESLSKAPRVLRWVRVFLALPYVLALVASAAMIWHGYSWVLTGTAIAGIMWNAAARKAAGKDDSDTGVWILGAWVAMIATLTLSTIHLLGHYRIP